MSKGHAHEDVSARVVVWGKLFRWHVAEADGLVEMHGGGEFGAGAEEQGDGAESAGVRDGVLKQAAADALSTKLRRDGHLRNLKHARAGGNEGDTADRFPARVGQEDVAALAKDGAFGVSEGLDVLGFESELAHDPFFVQGAKGGGVVAGAEEADVEGWGSGDGLLVSSVVGVHGKILFAERFRWERRQRPGPKGREKCAVVQGVEIPCSFRVFM
jgi:hypothetical protein